MADGNFPTSRAGSAKVGTTFAVRSRDINKFERDGVSTKSNLALGGIKGQHGFA
jgi:hypothetical protein